MEGDCSGNVCRTGSDHQDSAACVQLLKLPTDAKLGEDGSTTALWDGQQFVLEDIGESWWSSARFFWRYGYSPVTARNLVKKLKDDFLQLYKPQFLNAVESDKRNRNHTVHGYPWPSIESLSRTLDFQDAAATDARTWFYGKGVSQLFVDELIEAATRVNYGQNADKIHAVGAGVSLAASGAAGIRGGNYQLFSELLARSNARVHVGERGEVTGVIRYNGPAEAVAAGKLPASAFTQEQLSSREAKWWVGTANDTGGLYDAVFIAAPWHSAGITLLNTEANIPSSQYVRLHVTLLVTNASHPKAEYFGRGSGSDIPTTILTTHEAQRRMEKGQKAESNDSQLSWWHRLVGHKPSAKVNTGQQLRLDFNSLNYLAKLPYQRKGTSSRDHVVKIFSPQPMTDGQLDSLFGTETIGWIYRQEWDAYPELKPTRRFAPVSPDDGLFYINAMETLVSTMETSTVASRNAVALQLKKWFGLDFVVGRDCHFPSTSAEDVKDGEGDTRDGWDGWGCNAG